MIHVSGPLTLGGPASKFPGGTKKDFNKWLFEVVFLDEKRGLAAGLPALVMMLKELPASIAFAYAFRGKTELFPFTTLQIVRRCYQHVADNSDQFHIWATPEASAGPQTPEGEAK
jgi:hypothetical protein